MGEAADYADNILLVSSLGAKDVQVFKGEVQPILKDIIIEICSDSLRSAELLRMLKETKTVVLLEEAGTTRTEAMENEIRQIRNNGGNILGAVIL